MIIAAVAIICVYTVQCTYNKNYTEQRDGRESYSEKVWQIIMRQARERVVLMMACSAFIIMCIRVCVWWCLYVFYIIVIASIFAQALYYVFVSQSRNPLFRVPYVVFRLYTRLAHTQNTHTHTYLNYMSTLLFCTTWKVENLLSKQNALSFGTSSHTYKLTNTIYIYIIRCVFHLH